METYHSIIFNEISETPLVAMEDYGRKNNYILNFLYFTGSIDEEFLEEALKKAVIKDGLESYENVKRGIIKPDHAPAAASLAYVLSDENLLLNTATWKGIKFDHDETIKTFCERYGDDKLIDKLKDNLMNPRDLKSSEVE
jgi:hypothetical protein